VTNVTYGSSWSRRHVALATVEAGSSVLTRIGANANNFLRSSYGGKASVGTP